ncbi:MAG: ATP-dependent acyl-CoA ligase [Robiginitomaculum sp.]|nr:MAG: ATP-dependent acyl-CoA ligase [Robiginitomaculum sp.]
MSEVNNWNEFKQDTIIDALSRQFKKAPNALFLDFSGDIYTYRDIDILTNRLANKFLEMNIKAGDTVVTMLDNNVDAVVLWLSLNKIGAVSVPLNTALRGEFLRHQIANSEATLIICESDYTDRIIDIADGISDVVLLLHRGSLEKAFKTKFEIAALDKYRGDNESKIEYTPKPADLAALIYTSGTTGPSKGCMISYNYMMHLAYSKLQFNPATSKDVTFTPLPLFHLNAVATGVCTTVIVGGKIAFAKRFSVSNFWPEIERTGATIVSILGSIGTLLANAKTNPAMERCYGQLHTVRGNPFSPEIQQKWKERFGSKRVGSMDFGLSEAAIVTGIAGDEKFAPGSSGKRIDAFDVRIFDENDNEVSAGVSGEIVVRPRRPNIMFQGYWKRPDATQKVMRNMWFHTGDIGKFDEDGYFYFVDRMKDYLRRRGENISSFEMETAFSEHPDIEDVAVHAVFSPEGEDDVKVTAILKPGAKLTEKELCEWCLDKVPYYAVPRFIEFRETMPKNPQGRVLKYILREEGQTETTWDFDTSDVKIIKR